MDDIFKKFEYDDDCLDTEIKNISHCLRLEENLLDGWKGEAGQQNHIFMEMLNNMRTRAVSNSMDPDDYSNQLFEAKSLIQAMQYDLEGKRLSSHWSDDDDRKPRSYLWRHVDSPISQLSVDQVTPKIHSQFIETAGDYFRNSFLQTDALDKICIDAIIYHEYYLYLSDVREKKLYKKYRKIMNTPYKTIFFSVVALITQAALFLSLMTFLFNFDKHSFLLFGLGTGIYYLAKKIWPEKLNKKLKETKSIQENLLTFENLYNTCKIADFNSQMVWEACRSTVTQNKGIGFPPVLYDLLQRQSQREAIRNQQTLEINCDIYRS